MTIRIFFFAAALAAVSAVAQAEPIEIEMVTIGHAGNPADDTGYGAVGYQYQIGKYEVTNAQYCAFLNAVAQTDPNGLWNSTMQNLSINRGTVGGKYSYTLASNQANRPVRYISRLDAMRFVNWLFNGQPTGAQGALTTEDGVYDISLGLGATRQEGATYVLPNDNEWYKAAYYQGPEGTTGYYDYATGSDALPKAAKVETNGTIAQYYDPWNSSTVKTAQAEDRLAVFGNKSNAPANVGATNTPSPYGTFDQTGSVYEWLEDTYQGSNPVARGGAYSAASLTLLDSSHRRTNFPDADNVYVGFRVAAVPEPSTMALGCAAGLIGLAAWAGSRRRQSEKGKRTA
ncbi:MAG: SUMF1/EgtB/PvdO family nonheme iron enzyme [Planctomycetota bacterium]